MNGTAERPFFSVPNFPSLISPTLAAASGKTAPSISGEQRPCKEQANDFRNHIRTTMNLANLIVTYQDAITQAVLRTYHGSTQRAVGDIERASASIPQPSLARRKPPFDSSG